MADRCFIDNSSTSVDLLSSDTKTAESLIYLAFRYLFRAETVGFEPTCRLPDKLISSQPRYDHIDTSPISAGCDRPINFIRSPRKNKGIIACQPAAFLPVSLLPASSSGAQGRQEHKSCSSPARTSESSSSICVFQSSFDLAPTTILRVLPSLSTK